MISVLLSTAANSASRSVSLASAFRFAGGRNTASASLGLGAKCVSSIHCRNDSVCSLTPAWLTSVQNCGSPSAHVQMHFRNQRQKNCSIAGNSKQYHIFCVQFSLKLTNIEQIFLLFLPNLNPINAQFIASISNF